MKMHKVGVAVAVIILIGCARKDFPTARYQVDQPMSGFAACVYRDAQNKLDAAQTVNQTRLDGPEEIQIAKHAMYGAVAWEVDVTRSTSGRTIATLRWHPSLLSWDEEALASMNTCSGGKPLEAI